jgi:hypothetical protein
MAAFFSFPAFAAFGWKYFAKTGKCANWNRHSFPVPAAWLHKRRRANVRTGTGLGRVLFTSSPFQVFGSGEIEFFDWQALPAGRLILT